MAGNATIGALKVSLGLDSAQFTSGLKKAQGELGGFAAATRAGAIAGVALGVAVSGVAIAFTQARKAFAFADDIADTANRLAVTTKALQEYRFAVHALGGEYEDADAALEGFSKAFGAAHAGLTKRAAKPFEALGLDPKSFKTTEDALQAVIEKISNLSSTAEQAAIADKLGLTSMLPAIRAGTAAIDDAREAAERLGFVMDDAIVQKGGEANDRMEDLAHVLNVQINSALVDLAPLILKIGGAFGEAARGVQFLGDRLNALNNWAPGKALADFLNAMNGGAAAAGKATGRFLRTDTVGPALGLGPRAVDPRAEMRRRTAAGQQLRDGAANAPLGGGSLISPTGGGGSKHAKTDHSQEAIDAATRDQLQAQQDLTGDIEALAKLKSQEIDIELADKLNRLKQDVAQGDITKASAAIASAKYAQAAADQKELISRETAEKLAQQEIAQREAIGRYYDQIANITADMAGTVAEVNAIEAKNLNDRQLLDRRQLEADQAADHASSEGAKAAERAAQADLQAAEQRQQARKAAVRLEQETYAKAQAGLQLQIDILGSQADLATTTGARRAIDLKLLAAHQELERLAQQEILNSSKSTDDEKKTARDTLDALKIIHKNQTEASHKLETSFNDAASAVSDMSSAFKNQDWGGLFDGLANAVSDLQFAFSDAGTAADKVGAIAGIASGVGGIIGGKAGRALRGAASGAMAGFKLGSMIGQPVIGAIAGAILGGLGSLLKKKPSNHGAGAHFNADGTLTLTGNKRNADTEGAVKAAADGVFKGLEVLKGAGIKLTDTVQSITIGTRDASQIILNSGKTLSAAVGDPAAAAEAALKGLLGGATFVDETQKKLVDSMLAAGKGFDDIAATLSNFAAAQGFQKQIGDAILAITDPNAFTLQQLKESQAARRAEIKKALDEGLIDPQRFASLNVQLNKLDGLELDKTLKGFADATRGAVSAASAATDEWDSIRQRLEDFRRSLTGAAGGAGPQQALAAAQAEFMKTATAAWAGDQTAAGALVDVSQAFLDALKAGASDTATFARGVNAIKAATAPGIGATANGTFAAGGGLGAEIGRQGYAMEAMATNIRRLADETYRQGRDGLYVRGAAPGEPVATAA